MPFSSVISQTIKVAWKHWEDFGNLVNLWSLHHNVDSIEVRDSSSLKKEKEKKNVDMARI
jgi:hypothetical protein